MSRMPSYASIRARLIGGVALKRSHKQRQQRCKPKVLKIKLRNRFEPKECIWMRTKKKDKKATEVSLYTRIFANSAKVDYPQETGQ
jgi:hypothetical protein